MNTSQPLPLIILGADHAGYRLKEQMRLQLEEKGYPVEDVGCYDEQSVDYPDISKKLADTFREKAAVYGLLVCGSGVGICMAANRFSWIRAVEAHDLHTAQMSRRHNDANVLCLGGRVLAPELAWTLLEAWLDTPFEGARHQHRIDLMGRLSC